MLDSPHCCCVCLSSKASFPLPVARMAIRGAAEDSSHAAPTSLSKLESEISHVGRLLEADAGDGDAHSGCQDNDEIVVAALALFVKGPTPAQPPWHHYWTRRYQYLSLLVEAGMGTADSGLGAFVVGIVLKGNIQQMFGLQLIRAVPTAVLMKFLPPPQQASIGQQCTYSRYPGRYPDRIYSSSTVSPIILHSTMIISFHRSLRCEFALGLFVLFLYSVSIKNN